MAKRERYSIVKPLDKGGMAEVFLGKSASLEGFDKVVAIKRVLPELARNERFVNMFLDEAKISLHLDHANIVSVFDVGRSGQSYFIVMEFIDGTNLKRLIEGHAMPVGLACYVAVEVCKALVYAHEKLDAKGQPQHIVHRDISPPNILISRDGEVKLTDFGLAAAASQIESTDPGVVKGKFAYLSPEAAVGEEVDLRADVFGLGVVLWEALAGRRLFQGKTDLETLQNVRACEVPPSHSVRHDIPASLDRILRRALAKNRADRYSSAREFGRELSKFLVQEGVSVTSYDLAAWIQERIDLPADVSRLSPSLVDSAVQHELERFVGVKDDSKIIPDVGAGRERSHTAQFAFEDPRLWGISEGGEVEEAVEQRFEDSPSGLLRIREGTSRIGKPLSDEEAADAPTTSGHKLPPRVGAPKRGLPSRKKPPTLPPVASKKPPKPTAASAKADAAKTDAAKPAAKPAPPETAASKPGPQRAAAPKRTMMMTPIDEAFFDALDDPASDTGATDNSATRPHRTAGAGASKVQASEKPAAPASSKPVPPPLTPPTTAPTPSAKPDAEAADAVSTPPPLEQSPPSIAAASPQDEAKEPEEVSVTTERMDASPAPKRAGKAPARASADARASSSNGGAGQPWVSQIVTVVAFGAVAYFSYLILAPALM